MVKNKEKTNKTVHYGKAQADFIISIRAAIDQHQARFFEGNDWKRLTPKGGRFVTPGPDQKLDVTSFYIKPVAAWVPHLLIRGYIPSCPKCKHARSVDATASTWITTPRTLYGVHGHQYLDTKIYMCRTCKTHFPG